MRFCGKTLVLASIKLYSVTSKCLEMVVSLEGESMHRKGAAALLSIREWIKPALPVPKRSERMKQPACVTIKAKASGNETLLSELASTAVASASCKTS